MRALSHVLILVILGILIVQNVSYASEPVVIEKSGRWIKVDGEKLGKEASLAYISDNFGADASAKWVHYSKIRNAGMITAISSGAVAGISGGLCLAYFVGGALGKGFEGVVGGILGAVGRGASGTTEGGTTAGGASGTDKLFGAASALGITCIVSSVACCTGIVLLCVGDTKLKKMVKGFNVAQVVGVPVQLCLGPQSCGFGLALKF